MMKEEKYSPYSQCCGRPMRYAPENKCHYTNGCCLDEYPHKMPGCIRNRQPDCMAKAVIPAVTVDNVDNIYNLADCFVHVASNNTTYYIDDKHRIMIVWAGPVETEIPADVDSDEKLIAFVKTFDLRSQFLYAKYHGTELDTDGIIAFYFDKTGELFWAGEFNQVVEG